MKQKQILFIIATIAIVNALGYGIIIPILYPYSLKFSLNDFQNGLLFALFSVCQFISTPIIGRLSDKFGRKPLLLISLCGTALSFIMAAFAPSAIWLFAARALDGITAGNIPVAQAVISDSTDEKNRSKGFGIIGASFGFGFVFGPAISALTIGWGSSVPFIIAAAVTFISILLTLLFLPETNRHMGGVVKKAPLLSLSALRHAFIDNQTKNAFWLILLFSIAFSLFIYGFQPFSNKDLSLSAQQIAIVFTAVGVMSVASQILVLPKLIKKVGDKKGLLLSLNLSIFTFLAFTFVPTYPALIIVTLLNAFVTGPIGPLSQAMLSKNVDSASQGSILGLGAATVSVGQILGPVMGGFIATISPRLPFVVTSAIMVVSYVIARKIPVASTRKESAFK